MKKIIYSLVIMIAAGSLFTSCIDPVEPNGIYDLREAKADYLDALGKLRAADAKVSEADAAFRNAEAKVQEAIAEEHQALADKQKLLNERQKAQNDEEKARIDAQIKWYQEQSAINSETNAKLLAKAQEELAVALKDIEANAMLLTVQERNVVKQAAKDYTDALTHYETALNKWITEVSNNASTVYDKNINWEVEYTKALDAANADVVYWSEKLADFEIIDNEPAQWKAKIEDYQEEIAELEYKVLEMQEEEALAYMDFREAVAELKEFAKGVIESIEDPGVAGTFTAEAEIFENNDFVLHAIETLLANAMSGTPSFSIADGKMKFTDASGNVVDMIFNGVPEASAGASEIIGLKKVVEILEIEGLVNNPNYEEFANHYGNLYHKADSTYKADFDRLVAGIGADAAIASANADFTADTTAMSAAQASANAAEIAIKADSTAIKAAVAAAVKGYDDAVQAVYDAFNRFITGDNSFATKSDLDSSAFINALRKLGEAQKEYFGKEDTLEVYKEFNTSALGAVSAKPAFVALSELEDNGFVQVVSGNAKASSIYGGTGKGWYKGTTLDSEAWYSASPLSGKMIASANADDAFIRVMNAIVSGNAAFQVSNNATWYNNIALADFDTFKANLKRNITIGADTVGAAKNYISKEEDPLAKYIADTTALKAAKLAFSTASGNAASANAAIAAAKVAYYGMYNNFWGLSAGSKGYANVSGNAVIFNGADSLKISWAKDAFDKYLKVSPNVVGAGVSGNAFAFLLPSSGNANGASVWYDSQLAALLDAYRIEGVDAAGSYANFATDPKTSHIIWGQTSGSATELTKRAYYESLKDYFTNYTENEAAIEAFAAAVTELEAAVAAQASANAEASAEYYAQLTEIVGPFEAQASADAIIVNIGKVAVSGNASYIQTLNISSLDKLAEMFGTGSFAEKATELLGEYVTMEFNNDAREAEIIEKVTDLDKAIAKLTAAYNSMIGELGYQDGETVSGNASGNAYAVNYKAFVNFLQDKIDDAQDDVYEAQKSLDMFRAGFDPDMINVESFNTRLAQLEEKLEFAKAELEAAKARYEAVIAKYCSQN